METSLPDFNSLWNYAKPEKTRKAFCKIESEIETSANLDYKLQLKTQIARTYGLEGKFQKAHQVLDQVWRQLNIKTKVAEIRYYLELGRVFNSANNTTDAKLNFMKAFDLANAVKQDIYIIDAAHMMAIISNTLADKGNWNHLGLETAKLSNDKKAKRWIGVLHNNIGWDFFGAKKYHKALQEFQSCKEFYSESSKLDRLKIANYSIAKTLRLLGRIDEAMTIQMELFKQQNEQDDTGYTYEELAELYLAKDELEKSKSFFAKAYQKLSKDPWLKENEKRRLNRIDRLSK